MVGGRRGGEVVPELMAFAMAGVVGLLVGLAFGGAIAPPRAPEWLSAIATTAAAVIALWIALAEGRRRRRDEADRAALVAARLCGTLVAAAADLDGFCVASEFHDSTTWRSNLMRGAEQAEMVDRIIHHAGRAGLRVDSDILVQLTPLPNRAAVRLAVACGLIEAVHSNAVGLRATLEWNEGSLDWRQDQIERMLATVRGASRYFAVAVRELQVAADIHAPFPTDAEVNDHRDSRASSFASE